MSYETFYHYTNYHGALGILKERRIRKTTYSGTFDDATHGEGVYLTKVDPSNPQGVIGHALWWGSGAGPKATVTDGKADYVFRINILRGSVMDDRIGHCRKQPGSDELKNAFLYRDRDLLLDECADWAFCRVDDHQRDKLDPIPRKERLSIRSA